VSKLKLIQIVLRINSEEMPYLHSNAMKRYHTFIAVLPYSQISII